MEDCESPWCVWQVIAAGAQVCPPPRPLLRPGLPPHRCLLWLYPLTSATRVTTAAQMSPLAISSGCRNESCLLWESALLGGMHMPGQRKRILMRSEIGICICPACMHISMLHVHAVKIGMPPFDCSGSAFGLPGTLRVAGAPAWNRLSMRPVCA